MKVNVAILFFASILNCILIDGICDRCVNVDIQIYPSFEIVVTDGQLIRSQSLNSICNE
jgi:hypothetical protein